MYRVDDATAAATLPALPTDNIGTPGYFTGGDPGASPPLPATRVRFWWLNMIQEEIAAVVSAAGIALSKGLNNQLLTALRSLFNVQASYSGPNNGFISFPGGIYHETFTASVPCGGGIYQTNLTLPTAFPTNCLDATISFGGNSPPGAAGSISVQPLSRTQVAVTTNFQAPGPLGVVIKAYGV